jgi:lipid-A-disaccharide synthase-like uncharacterized protein
MIIGLIGMFFLILAWLPEIKDTIKKGGKGIDPRFGVLTVLGDVFLIIYSYQIADLVFFMLNSILLVMALTELILSLKKRARKGRKK